MESEQTFGKFYGEGNVEMYYATYRLECVKLEFAAFHTKEERDAWVQFEDDFSKQTMMNPEISLPRCKVTDRRLIRKLEDENQFRRVKDEFGVAAYWLVGR